MANTSGLYLMISPLTVIDRYDDLLTGFVLDRADGVLVHSVQVPTLVTDTIMTDLASKAALAEQVLAFAQRLTEQPTRQAHDAEADAMWVSTDDSLV